MQISFQAAIGTINRGQIIISWDFLSNSLLNYSFLFLLIRYLPFINMLPFLCRLVQFVLSFAVLTLHHYHYTFTRKKQPILAIYQRHVVDKLLGAVYLAALIRHNIYFLFRSADAPAFPDCFVDKIFLLTYADCDRLNGIPHRRSREINETVLYVRRWYAAVCKRQFRTKRIRDTMGWQRSEQGSCLQRRLNANAATRPRK